jgi:hypothetical protein
VLIAAAPAQAELIHHWKLDETTGSAVAEPVRNAHGTVGGAYAWTVGRIGNGFKTSGSSLGYVNNGDVPFTGSFALSFWVNPEDATLDWRNMISKHDGDNGARSFWVGQRDVNGGLRFGLYFDGTNEVSLDTPGGLISSGQWAHVTASWNEQTRTQSLYVNGNLAASAVRTGQSFLFPRSSNLLFSTNNTSTSTVVGVGSWARFPGMLDDVAAWDTLPQPGQLKAMAATPGVAGVGSYNAADFEKLIYAYDTNWSVEIGSRRWKRATGLAVGAGGVATAPNGHVMQFDASGAGVSSLSTVRLTADPLYTNLADSTDASENPGAPGLDGSHVRIFEPAPGSPWRSSEIDGLISDESIGSADFRPFQTSAGDVYVMHWLIDVLGTDDRALLRSELDAVSGSTYDVLHTSDPAWTELAGLHGGFDTLLRFNGTGVAGAFNWDFASHTDIRVDRMAVVTTGTDPCIPEPATGAVLGVAAGALRRRSGRRHAR